MDCRKIYLSHRRQREIYTTRIAIHRYPSSRNSAISASLTREESSNYKSTWSLINIRTGLPTLYLFIARKFRAKKFSVASETVIAGIALWRPIYSYFSVWKYWSTACVRRDILAMCCCTGNRNPRTPRTMRISIHEYFPARSVQGKTLPSPQRRVFNYNIRSTNQKST